MPSVREIVEHFIYEFRLWLAWRRIVGLTNACHETGGELSPYFQDLQNAYSWYQKLKENPPCS